MIEMSQHRKAGSSCLPSQSQVYQEANQKNPLRFNDHLPFDLINKYQIQGEEIQMSLGEPEEYHYEAMVVKDNDEKIGDLSNLKNLIQRAIKAGQKIEGKDAVFLLGKSGSGKSTLIHLLAGINLLAKERLTIVKNKKGKIDDIEDQKKTSRNIVKEEECEENKSFKDLVLVPEKQLNEFEIGHEKASKTKLMNTFEERGIILVDTPGLQDSDGEQFDIANSIGLQNAFSKAKSIQFLLVISQNLIIEGRGNDMRDLMSEFLGYVPNISLNKLLPSITVLISHSKYDKQSIIYNLQSIAQKKIEGLSEKAKIIIEEIAKQLQKSKSSKLNGVELGTQKNMTSKEFSNQIFNQLKNGEPLNIDKVDFSISLKPTPIKYLLGKMNQLKNIIQLNSKNYQFRSLKSYFKQLQFIRKYIKSQEIIEKYNECLFIVDSTIKELFISYSNNIQIFLTSHSSGEDIKKLQQICKNIFFLKQADALKNEIDKKYFEKDQLKNYSEQMVKKVKEQMNFIIENLSDFKQISSLFSKLQKLYLKFGKQIRGMEEIYRNFSKQLVEIVFQKIKEIQKAIEKGYYDQLISSWTILRSLLNILKVYYKKDIFNLEDILKQFFVESLKYRYQNSVGKILKKLSESEVQNLHNQYNKFKSILNQHDLEKIIGEESFKKLSEDMKSQIEKQLSTIIEQIQSQIAERNYKQLKKHMQVLNKIEQTNKQLSLLIDRKYYSIIHSFMYELFNEEKFNELQIKIVLGNFNQIDELVMYKFIQRMSKLKQFESLINKDGKISIYHQKTQFLEKYCQKENKQLRNKIEKQLQKKKDQVRDNQSINKIYAFIKKMSELNEQKLLNQVQKSNNIIRQIIEERISKISSYIKTDKVSIQNYQVIKNLQDLHNLKRMIKDYPSNDINKIIQSFYVKAIQEIKKGERYIQNINIENYQEKFVNLVRSLMTLFEIFEKLSDVFGDYEIYQINRSKSKITNILKEKFEKFYDKIQKILSKENDLTEVQKYLVILEKYKKLDINNEFNKQIRYQYDKINDKCYNKTQQHNFLIKIIMMISCIIIFVFFLKYLSHKFASFQDTAKAIQNSFEKWDYKNVYQGLTQLERFQGIPNVIGSNYGSPTEFKEKIIKKISIQHNRLFKKIIEQLKRQTFQQFHQIRNFTNLLIASRGNSSNSALDIFHTKMQNYLRLKIPDLDTNAEFDSKYQKYDSLKNENQLIGILKNYVDEINDNFYNKSQKTQAFRLYISSLPLPQLYLKQMKQNITKLKQKEFPKLWSQGKIAQISKKLSTIQKLSKKGQLFKSMHEQYKKSINSMINKQAQQILKKIQDGKYSDLDQRIYKLKLAEQELNQPYLQQINNFFNKKMQDIEKKAMKESQAKVLVTYIIQLKQLSQKITSLTPDVTKLTKSILNRAKNNQLIGQIIAELDDRKSKPQKFPNQTILCSQIMHDYSADLQIPRIIHNITMSYQNAIKKFDLNGTISKLQLTRQAKIYNETYETQKQKYIARGNQEKILENLDEIKNQIRSIKKKLNHNQQLCQNIPKIIANIFVYWSLSKSGEQFYNSKRNGKYLLQPHPIQVLSILSFIGCQKISHQKVNLKTQTYTTSLSNHLMQIKTGQGKSVILGVMSILLALMDHNVDCVSYSKYLSTRDYEDFKQIFIGLEVSDRISYGTFHQITQKIINEHGNVRDLTSQLFMPNQQTQRYNKYEKRPYAKRVLLVDEVDTFFSKDFYGETYNPITLFQNNQITEIINLIWKKRSEVDSSIVSAYKNSEMYKTLSKDFTDTIHLIDEQFSLMIKDVKTFDNLDYVVQNGTIGYKQLDGVSFNNVYGYKTMFTYIYESQPGREKVPVQKANSKKGVILTCGKFSYAEMITEFDMIFGVTGTLESLSEFEQKILNRYKITKKSFAPSVYGDSSKVERPIKIQKDKSLQFQTIAQVIQSDLDKQAAVLVFFETEEELKQFRSQYASKFTFKIVTEKTNQFQRNNYIKMATRKKCVTLFTASFGRGTDFVVHDPVVEKVGVTVIQTFLSQEPSEEIQIKGRTARQGKVGNYELILNEQSLEKKFKITKLMIEKAKQSSNDFAKNLLHQKRIKYLSEKNAERQIQVERAKISHQDSMDMKHKMKKKYALRNDPFFWKNRQYSSKSEPIHFILALDESSSMSGQKWTQLVSAVQKTLQKIVTISKQRSNIFVSIINFQNLARLIYERTNPNQINVTNIDYAGGSTNFQPVFEMVYNLALKTINQQTIFFIFMTDGEAYYPSTGIRNFQNLLSSNPNKFKYAGIQFQCNTNIMKQISTELKGENLQANNIVQLVKAYDKCLDFIKFRSSPVK